MLAESLAKHWPEYLMEAAQLGVFMVSACMFGSLLEHPDSVVRRRIENPLIRRAIMGVLMGMTAVTLIYSPWGQQSGAHMNPAVTLTFLWLGKVAVWDALFYVVAQGIGAVCGVLICWVILRGSLGHPSVKFVVTEPGQKGVGIAWVAELGIAFLMMLTVLTLSNRPSTAPITGFVAGCLVAAYITFEAPFSGMSMNPARTLGSAVPARSFRAFWVYLTAPLLGMFLASVAYASLPGDSPVHCAKLNHHHQKRCIFRCNFCSDAELKKAFLGDRQAPRP